MMSHKTNGEKEKKTTKNDEQRNIIRVIGGQSQPIM
jgi:hypothetical protein